MKRMMATLWLVLAGVQLHGAVLDAPFSSVVPTIDGSISGTEWSGASSNVISMVRGDSLIQHSVTAYLKHDGTWLYIGVNSGWASGWDVYACLFLDGNNNHLRDGNSGEPHIDIQTQYPAPGAWSGCNGYFALLSSNSEVAVTAPVGTSRASAGSGSVTYEFKVSLSELGVIPGGSFGFAFLLGTDGTGQGGYYWPATSANWIAGPAQWADVRVKESTAWRNNARFVLSDTETHLTRAQAEHIQLASDAGLKFSAPFSVGGWFKTDSRVGQGNMFALFSMYNAVRSPPDGYTTYIDQNGMVVFSIIDTSGTTRSITSLSSCDDNAWHFHMGVWDGQYLRLYVDGQAQGTPVSTPYGPKYYSAHKPGIGAVNTYGDLWVHHFDGSVRSFFVATNAFGAADVLAAYHQTSNTLALGLVAYYPFNGNANDESGNGNNGISSGGVRYDKGVVDTCVRFDGVDDQVLIPSNTVMDVGTNSFTASLWFRTQDAVGYMLETRYGENPVRGYTLGLWSSDPTGPYFQIENGYVPTSMQVRVDSSQYQDNTWHMMTGVREGILTRLYMDGRLVRETIGGGIDIGNSQPLRIAAPLDANLQTRFYDGELDDLRIYSRAMTSAEIWSLYVQATKFPTLPIVTNILLGTAGNEVARNLCAASNAVFLAGTDSANGGEGLLARYNLPLGTGPVWSVRWPNLSADDSFFGLCAVADGIVAVGNSYGRTTDAAGGKESKGLAVQFSLAGATGSGYGGCTWDRQMPANGAFPYLGTEELWDVAPAQEGTQTLFYAVGRSQQNGMNGGRQYLAKFNSTGGVVWCVNDATEMVNNAYSRPGSVAILDGNVYTVGLTYDSGTIAPSLRKYDAAGNLQWKRELGVSNLYEGVTAFGGSIYAVGQAPLQNLGPADVLIEKWAASGTRVWSRAHDLGGTNEVLRDIVGLGDQLYAVGTSDRSATNRDMVVVQIDPASGDLRALTFWGGAADEEGNGIATDGRSLFVVGETASYGGGGKDAVLVQLQTLLPVIENGGVSNIGTTSATLIANVASTGASPTTVRIYWGPTDGGTNAAAWGNVVSIGVREVGPFSTNVYNLVPNASYYYRCWASNAAGVVWAAGTTNFMSAGGAGLAPQAVWLANAPTNGYLMSKSYTTVDNRIYLFGGTRPDSTISAKAYSTIWVCDLNTRAWSLAQYAMPYEYDDRAMVQYLNGRFYAAPGFATGDYNGWGSHDRVIEIDTVAQTSREAYDFPQYGHIWAMETIAANGKVYFIGGHNGSDQASISEFDPATSGLVSVASMTYARSLRNAVYGSDGWIYIWGDAPAIERFHPVTHVVQTRCSTASAFSYSSWAHNYWHIPQQQAIYIFVYGVNPTLYKYDYALDVFTNTGVTVTGDFSQQSGTTVLDASDPNTIYGMYGESGDPMTSQKLYKLNLFADTDTDGLADWWEIQYFGNLNPTGSGDLDGDGFTDRQEYQNGTDPTRGLPAIANPGASNITASSGVLWGNLVSAEGSSTTVRVYWGPTDGGVNEAAWGNRVELGVRGVGPFAASVTGLSAASTYYYRCWASNAAGVAWAGSSASFTTLGTFAISASAGAHGSVSPTGVVYLTYQADQTYRMLADAGYHVADVLVDGVSVGAATNYTFTSVTTNHTISATFAIDTYGITATSGANGSVTPTGVTAVAYGGRLTYTITPAAFYRVASVLVDGTSVGAMPTYLFVSVTNNHAISVTFERIPSGGGAWFDLANLPVGRHADWGACSVVNGKIHVIGSHDSESNPVGSGTRNDQYDPSSGAWRSLSRYPRSEGRGGIGGAAVWDSEVYFFGGVNNWNSYTVSTVDRYNAATDQWTLDVGVFPLNAGNISSVRFGSGIYCFGGAHYGGPCYSNVYFFNPSNGTFVSRHAMPSERWVASSFIYGTQIWACAGGTTTGIVNDVLIYDPAADAWQQGPAIPVAELSVDSLRWAGVAGDGLIYFVFSSRPASDPLSKPVVVRYSPVDNTWTPMAESAHGYGDAGVACVGDRIYCIGGDYLKLSGSFSAGMQCLDLDGVAPACRLVVNSAYGVPEPSRGTSTNDWGSMVDCRCSSVDLRGGTQYVCKGWVGSGSVPASGTTTSVVVTITNDSSITWVWATNHWLSIGVAGVGGVDRSNQWVPAGSNVTVTATASNGWYFSHWAGDTNGCAVASNRITAALTQARGLVANFAAVAAPTNRAPVVCVASQQVFLASMGELATMDAGCSSDPDGDVLFYSWREDYRNPALGLAPIGSEALPVLKLYLPTPGQYRFDVRVSDGVEMSTETRTITVYVPGQRGVVNFDPTDVVRVPDARLSVYRTAADMAAGTNPVDVAITDSRGRFTLDGVCAASTTVASNYHYKLERDGFVEQSAQFTIRPDPGANDYSTVYSMSRGTAASLAGTVKGPTGAALGGVTVAIIPGTGGSVYSSTTGTNGGFRIPFVPYGSWVLQLIASGGNYRPEARDLSVGPGMTNLEFRMAPAVGTCRMVGRVTVLGTGRGVDRALVKFLGTSTEAYTDSQGYYTLSGVSVGTYAVLVNKTGYEPVRLPIVTLAVGTNTVDAGMAFAGKGPTVFGTVTDRLSGRPVRNATVGVETTAGLLLRSDVTDFTGWYRLLDVPAGSNQTFRVSACGYQSKSVTATVSDFLGLDVALERAANWRAPRKAVAGGVEARTRESTIFLTAMTQSAFLCGTNSVGVGLRYLWRESPNNPILGLLPADSEAQGIVQISGFSRPGIYRFELQVKDGTDISPNTATITVFVPGLAGNVHASPSDGVVGLSQIGIKAYANYADALAWNTAYADSKSTRVSPMGDFALDGLSAGTYWLAARENSRTYYNNYGPVLRRVNYSSGAGKTDVNLSKPETMLDGRVTDSVSGLPLENVRVVVAPGSVSESFRTTSDASGYYKLNFVPTGAGQMLLMMKEGYQTVVSSLSFDTSTTWDAVLTPATGGQLASVSGRVTANFQGIELPVAYAEVVLGSGLVRAFTDSLGNYEIRDLPPGAYYGTVRKDGYKAAALFDAGYKTLAAGGNTGNNRVLQFDDAHGPVIRGTVLNQYGEQLDGVRVTVLPPAGFLALSRRTLAQAATTNERVRLAAEDVSDAGGVFQFNGIPDGERQVVVEWAGGVYTNTVNVAGNLEAVLVAGPRTVLSYEWVTQYFGSVTNPLGRDAADPDGDGVSNADEWAYGTDPLDRTDPLRFGATDVRSGRPILNLGWLGSGSVYEVWWATNLMSTNAWQASPWSVTGAGTRAEISWTNVLDRVYFRSRKK